jgi:hypothetical protein
MSMDTNERVALEALAQRLDEIIGHYREGAKHWPKYADETRGEIVVLQACAALCREKLAALDETWRDEVCACLDETGECNVELVERCLRCGTIMEHESEGGEATASEDGQNVPERLGAATGPRPADVASAGASHLVVTETQVREALGHNHALYYAFDGPHAALLSSDTRWKLIYSAIVADLRRLGLIGGEE